MKRYRYAPPKGQLITLEIKNVLDVERVQYSSQVLHKGTPCFDGNGKLIAESKEGTLYTGGTLSVFEYPGEVLPVIELLPKGVLLVYEESGNESLIFLNRDEVRYSVYESSLVMEFQIEYSEDTLAGATEILSVFENKVKPQLQEWGFVLEDSKLVSGEDSVIYLYEIIIE